MSQFPPCLSYVLNDTKLPPERGARGIELDAVFDSLRQYITQDDLYNLYYACMSGGKGARSGLDFLRLLRDARDSFTSGNQPLTLDDLLP